MATYRFHSQIGEGGFGIVREATRQDDGWVCVAKFLREGYDEEDLQRFQREVRMQAGLDHSHVVPIIAMNMKTDPPWFVMPKALMNLREFLRQNRGEDSLWTFSEAAQGIAYAHSNGVIHRDVKPENILIFGERELYAAVGDFGLGRKLERDTPTLTQSHVRMGTVEYAPPELFTDARSADQRSDVYCLGKVLYEVLTGEVPYPSLDLSRLPREFIYVVQKATEDDPARRYQSVADLLSDFDLVTTSRGALGDPATVALEMAQELVAEQAFDDDDSLESLARHLCGHLDDYQMLGKVLPKLPGPIVEGLLRHHLSTFKQVLRAFDEQATGSQPFDYCDVIADFYEVVYSATEDLDIRTLILRRLPSLGEYHNRWHVGNVFGRLAGVSLGDPVLVMVIRDTFRDDPAAGQWCLTYLSGFSLPQTIRQALSSGPG